MNEYYKDGYEFEPFMPQETYKPFTSEKVDLTRPEYAVDKDLYPSFADLGHMGDWALFKYFKDKGMIPKDRVVSGQGPFEDKIKGVDLKKHPAYLEAVKRYSTPEPVQEGRAGLFTGKVPPSRPYAR